MYFNFDNEKKICEIYLDMCWSTSRNFKYIEKDLYNVNGLIEEPKIVDYLNGKFKLYRFSYNKENTKKNSEKDSFENFFIDKKNIIRRHFSFNENEYNEFRENIISNCNKYCNTSKHKNTYYTIEGKTLYKHQQDVFDLVENTDDNGFALFMEMGTGKTFVSISIIINKFLKEKDEKENLNFKVLVVGPKDALTSWATEMDNIFNLAEMDNKHCRCYSTKNNYNVYLYNLEGNPKKRKNILKQNNKGVNIYLLSCDSANKTLYGEDNIIKDFDICIADESQFMKNPTSQRSEIMHYIGDKLDNKLKLILSGTPIANNLNDLWSQFRFLRPKHLKESNYSKSLMDFNIFKSEHSYTLYQMTVYSGLGKYIDFLSNISYFIDKESVMKEVPSPVDLIEEIDLEEEKSDYNELSNMSRETIINTIDMKDYLKYKNIHDDKLRKELEDISEDENIHEDGTYNIYSESNESQTSNHRKDLNGKIKVSIRNILGQYIKLQQFTGGIIKTSEGTKLVSTKKKNKLIEIINKILNEDISEKIVIFAHYTHEVNMIEKEIKNLNINYEKFNAQDNSEKRKDKVKNFQTNKNCRIFLSQIRCGSRGITLTSSRNIIYYSMNFSYIDYAQSRARIFRIGQKKKCRYYHLICKDTIDEYILQSLRYKSEMSKYLAEKWKVILDNPDGKDTTKQF